MKISNSSRAYKRAGFDARPVSLKEAREREVNSAEYARKLLADARRQAMQERRSYVR
jgi:hypothetical protein